MRAGRRPSSGPDGAPGEGAELRLANGSNARVLGRNVVPAVPTGVQHRYRTAARDGTARCRYRPTFAAAPCSKTRPGIRPSTRAMTVRSRPPRRDCISTPSLLRALPRARGRDRLSDPARGRRHVCPGHGRGAWRITAFTPSGAVCRPSCARKDSAGHEQQRRAHVVAVGTTTVRALESAAMPTVQLRSRSMARRRFSYGPGFGFRPWIDSLITNFHLPESSLLMLVCALGGTRADPCGVPPRRGAALPVLQLR